MSVAVTDGVSFGAQTSQVVVAYERNGESWRSWSTVPGGAGGFPTVWNKAGGGMPAPPAESQPTDSFAFGRYEGWPTVLAFQGNQDFPNDWMQHVLYFTKFGSVTNGSTVTSGSGGRFSTDVAILRSTNGGVAFATPVRLTRPPTNPNVKRWKIEYPVATNCLHSNGFISSQSMVAWKQTPINQDDSEGSPQWRARYVNADYTATSGITPAASLEPLVLPIPGTSSPITFSCRWPYVNTVKIAYATFDGMKLLSDGVTWDASNRCPNPSPATRSVTWLYTQTECDSTTCTGAVTDNIWTDTQWKPCVGASRNTVSGTPWNKQLIQPRLVVDPVTLKAYVAITANANDPAKGTRLRLHRKVGSGPWTNIFTTPNIVGAVGIKDEWAPTLGIYRYSGPGETTHIYLGRRSTFTDTLSVTKNERIRQVATRSADEGAIWETPEGFPIDGLATAYDVTAWMGAYDGVMGMSYFPEAWQAGWADPRNPPTSKVYGATIIP
ncbi:MAG: hypothetical protein WKG00_27345 [Polyangiaceae bacterium]